MQLDETDQQLLDLLGLNARMPVATLARKLSLARTTVQTRLDRLEHSGVIQGYTVRLHADIRPQLQATVLLMIEPRSAPAILARLKSLTAVRQIITTSGRYDLMVLISAERTQDLDETLDKIGETKGVRGSDSMIHLTSKLDRRRGP